MRIMIYGDSNTYGYNAETGGRFDKTIRWPGVAQNILGTDYRIIEEGLNGRSTRNGLSFIGLHTENNLPIDVMCVKLGSNDMDDGPHMTPEILAAKASEVLKKAREVIERSDNGPCRYVLMAPLEMTEEVYGGPFRPFFRDDIVAFSKKAAVAYEKQAVEDGFLFFDANKYAKCGLPDGVHLDAKNHVALGKAFAAWAQENL